MYSKLYIKVNGNDWKRIRFSLDFVRHPKNVIRMIVSKEMPSTVNKNAFMVSPAFVFLYAMVVCSSLSEGGACLIDLRKRKRAGEGS
jgi:hypothetical protein